MNSPKSSIMTLVLLVCEDLSSLHHLRGLRRAMDTRCIKFGSIVLSLLINVDIIWFRTHFLHVLLVLF